MARTDNNNYEAIAAALRDLPSADPGRDLARRRKANAIRPSKGSSRRRAGSPKLATVAAQRKASKKKKKDDSSILDTLGSGVMSALEAVDVPRSVVQSTIADVAEAAATGDVQDVLGAANPLNIGRKVGVGLGEAVGVDVGGADDLYYKKRHAKDLLEHTGAGTYLERGLKDAGLEDTWLNNQWVKRGLGFAGDVASDPLTYVGGAGVLAHGAEATAAEVGRTGASKIAKKLAEEAGVSTADKIAMKSIRQEATRQAEEAAAKIVSKRSASALTKEEMQTLFGTKGGLKFRVPGTGRVVGKALGREGGAKELTLLPKEVTDVLGAPTRALRNKVGDSKVANALAEKLGGQNPELRTMLRSGDTRKINDALITKDVMRTAASRAESGLRLMPDAKIGDRVVNAQAKFGKGQAKGLGARAMDVYTHEIKPLLKGRHEEIMHAIETGDTASVQGAQEVSDFLRELHRAAVENGVPLAQRENYFPRWLTEEAQAARGGKRGVAGKAGFVGENARANEKIAEAVQKQTGEVIDVADEAKIRSTVEEWASRELPNLPGGYYEKNIDKLLPHYVEALTDRVRTQEIVNRLQAKGILVPAWIEQGGTLTKKAAKQAEKALAQAEKAATKGEGYQAAADEAAAHAKLMGALADTSEAEAKTAAQRQAAAEADAAFQTMGGFKGMEVHGASDGVDWSDPESINRAIEQGNVSDEAAAQLAEQQRLAQLDAAERAGQVVNPEAAAREAAAQAMPPDVLAAAERALNAPAAKQRATMEEFQAALDAHGLHAEDVIAHMADLRAAGTEAAQATADVVPTQELFGRLQAMRASGDPNNAFANLSEQEMQPFRDAFASAFEKRVEEGGVKFTAGGRYSNAERTRRAAAKLNGHFEQMDAALEAAGLETQKLARQRKALRGLAADKSGALEGLKGKTGALGDLPEPSAADLGVVTESPLERAAREAVDAMQATEKVDNVAANRALLDAELTKGERTVTMYRGEPAENVNAARGLHFHRAEGYAQKMAGENGRVYKVEVPESVATQAEKFNRANGDVGGMLPERYADVASDVGAGSQRIDIPAALGEVDPTDAAIARRELTMLRENDGSELDAITGPSREANDLARFEADAAAGIDDPAHVENVLHEAQAAGDVLHTRRVALEGAIETGQMTDEQIAHAITSLAADVQSTTERVANGIAPLRHPSAFSGELVADAATPTAKDAVFENANGALYRSQRTAHAQSVADEATGVYSSVDQEAANYVNDAEAGINDSMGPGGPDQAALPAGQQPLALTDGRNVGTQDPNTGAWIMEGNGPRVPTPTEVSTAALSAEADRRSFQAGMEDARSKLKQAQDRGWDTTYIERRVAIYEQALTEADPIRARALQFQADALDAMEHADRALTEAATLRQTAQRLQTPKVQRRLLSEIDKSMSRLRVDPSLAAPNEIADILDRVSQVNTPEGVRKFLTHYDKALNYIKAWQIATPGFHVRNFMGGMFNNYLAGVELNSYSRFWRDRNAFLNGKLTEGPRYEAMKELLPHVGSAQYSAFEVGGLEQITKAQRINPLSKNNQWLVSNRKAGGSVEEMLRGALGYDRLLKGQTIDQAVADITKYHFDYQDLSRFERNTVKRVIPFYTWTRHNLPLQMEQFMLQPGKYARYWQAKQEIEMGTDPEGVVPSYFLNEGFGIHTPFKFGGGDQYLTPDLPFTTTVQQALPDLSGVNPSAPGTYLSALDGYASMATPLLKTPVERVMNRQFFKGIPFQDKKLDAPKLWDDAPGVGPALRAAGLIDGKGKITDRDLYTVEQYLPLLGRMRRLGGGSKKDDDRLVSSWMSFLGVPLKTNTPYEQQLERYRRKFKQGPKPNPYARKKY